MPKLYLAAIQHPQICRTQNLYDTKSDFCPFARTAAIRCPHFSTSLLCLLELFCMSSARSRCRIFPAQRDMLQLLMMWMLIFVLVFLVHETQFWMCLHPNNNPQQRLFKENGFKLHNHDSHNHAELLMFCSIWLHFWLLCLWWYTWGCRGVIELVLGLMIAML